MKSDDCATTLTYVCSVAKVSRSGYHRYISSIKSRVARETKDEEAYELIYAAYTAHGRKKGARMIKMTLENESNITMNLKKIRRLMKKFGLFCPIRKANPYKKMARAMATNTIAKNVVQRNFNPKKAGQTLLTDITYLRISPKKFAYLSTIKDCFNNEIIAYQLSETLELTFVIETLEKLDSNPNITITSETLIHSDQGCHYTAHKFREKLRDMNIIQSMSRRGNCWDNAPQESFFGHMKDELKLKKQMTFEEIQFEIDDYMNYYNNFRYQWNLSRMSPVQFRNTNAA